MSSGFIRVGTGQSGVKVYNFRGYVAAELQLSESSFTVWSLYADDAFYLVALEGGRTERLFAVPRRNATSSRTLSRQRVSYRPDVSLNKQQPNVSRKTRLTCELLILSPCSKEPETCSLLEKPIPTYFFNSCSLLLTKHNCSWTFYTSSDRHDRQNESYESYKPLTKAYDSVFILPQQKNPNQNFAPCSIIWSVWVTSYLQRGPVVGLGGHVWSCCGRTCCLTRPARDHPRWL